MCQWFEGDSYLKKSSDNSARLKELQHKFTLLLSADYQIVQQVRKSVISIFGSNTFTEQINRACFCLMINNSKVIICSNKVSLVVGLSLSTATTCLYLSSNGSKGFQVFLDNAESTNKNKFVMASIYEVIQGISNYFRISIMMVGHTKSAPDQMFGQIARSYYSLGF